MQAILSLTFVLVIYAIADIIAAKTKSIVSSMFTCSVVFILGFWAGIPQTLFSDAQLAGIGGVLIPMLLVHMGTLMNLRQLKDQWKTVFIAVGAVIGITAMLLLVGPFIIGEAEALVAAPVISGGIVAALMMQTAVLGAHVANADALAIFAVTLMVMEGFIGYPVASFCLKREGLLIKQKILDGSYVEDEKTVEAEPKKKLLSGLFPGDQYDSEFVYIAKVAVIALLATWLSAILASLNGGQNLLDKNVIGLLLGILFCELGFLESRPLQKGNSMGLAMGGLLAVIFSSLSKATPAILFGILPAIIGANILGIIGYAILTIIVGKMVGISPWLSIAIGSTANFGFPGTYIISKEVAVSLGDTPDMAEKILNGILPKMLVAGFITVSIASVIIAGVIAAMI